MRSGMGASRALSHCNRPACMTASTSLSVFHQWLLADPASQASACAIVLHGGGIASSGRLILEIADYLNEYDDDGDGRWLPATPELIEKVCLDPNHRRLLGMSDAIPSQPEELKSEIRETLLAIAGRGHDLLKKCHIILNPDHMDQGVIAHIVGDVFLEWIHCEIRRNSPIQDIR
jgi:hypothetical protein